MTLLNGEPARRLPLRCAELLQAGEIWYFGSTDRIPHGFALVFVSGGVSESAPHRLWSPRSGYQELLLWPLPAAGDVAGEMAERIPRDCPRGEEIVGGLAAASDWNDLATRWDVIPHPNPEWVRTFLSYSTDLPEGALPLAARGRDPLSRPQPEPHDRRCQRDRRSRRAAGGGRRPGAARRPPCCSTARSCATTSSSTTFATASSSPPNV